MQIPPNLSKSRQGVKSWERKSFFSFVSLSRETKNFFGLVLFGATYGAALDYAHTHGGCIEYPEGTRHERGILTFATVYSVVPLMVSLYRMKTEHFIEIDPISDEALETSPLPSPSPPLSSAWGQGKDLLPSLTAAASSKSAETKEVKKEKSSEKSPSSPDGNSAAEATLADRRRASSSSPHHGSMYSLAIRSLPRNARVDFTKEENRRRRFMRKQQIAPWSHAFTAMSILFTSGYLLTAYAWGRMPSAVIAAVLACPTLYFFRRWDWSLNSLFIMIAVGVSGAGTEAFLNSYVKSMTYQTDDILGIPCWLFWVYTLNFSTYGQLTRFLLEPGHTTRVFVGVDNLPHRWARKFYANHVGLPKT